MWPGEEGLQKSWLGGRRGTKSPGPLDRFHSGWDGQEGIHSDICSVTISKDFFV